MVVVLSPPRVVVPGMRRFIERGYKNRFIKQLRYRTVI